MALFFIPLEDKYKGGLMTVIQIILLLVGAGLGGGVGYLVKAIQAKIKMNELENRALKAEKARENMIGELSKRQGELEKTKKLLRETIAAMEVLQAYKAIDEKTRKEVEEVKESLNDDGEATPETYDKFARIIDEMNKKNKEYNSSKSRGVT